MIVKQFYLGCLAHASYIVIDERTKTAVVIDPRRDVAEYLEEAARHGATIEYALLTHFHADFVSGHLELRERTGATIGLGHAAAPEYEFTPLRDGDALELGDVRLEIRETPGHTPESISIVLYDLATDSSTPHAVFTGDTLFVGDVGRPDLMAAAGHSALELAQLLYRSLREKLLTLPDATIVYPAHGAGSMCGKNLGKETHTTIGAQRNSNYALQPMSEEDFVNAVASAQPEVPQYFAHDAVLNRQERETLDASLRRALRPLGLERVLELRDEGARILDVRSADDFAAGHLAGSSNVGLDGKFATWAGTVLDPAARIVLIAEPGREEEAATRLGRIGLDGVAGYLEGGASAFARHPELVTSHERWTVAELATRLKADMAPLVLDVRGPGEREAGHIADSVHIPLNQLEQRIEELPRDRAVAVICGSGYRSSLAVSLLERAEHAPRIDVAGGMQAWEGADLPTVQPTAH